MTPNVGLSTVRSADEILSLIDKEVTGERFFVCSSATQLHDLSAGTPSEVILRQYDEGRCFSREAELRWQRNHGSFHLTLLTEKNLSASFHKLPDSFVVKKTCIRLLGKRSGNAWKDTRYTRDFHHPAKSGRERVSLDALQYIDERSGRVHYTRWCGLKED